jgi:transcriptional regulator with XRE-family HTH domain
MREGKQKQLGVAIGAALRHLREKSGLSQEELGFRFGLHRTYVSLLERGGRIPSVPTLLSLGEYLGASPVELMRLVERELSGIASSPAGGRKRKSRH